jgi:hypothetical protein
MAKSTEQLEKRLERVEQELAELKTLLTGQQPARWYRQIVGDFAGDEAFEEMARLGRLIRSGKLKT